MVNNDGRDVRQSGSVDNVIRKYGSREICWSSQGMLRLSTEAMRRLFQPTLERIKQAIGDVLNHPNARGKSNHWEHVIARFFTCVVLAVYEILSFEAATSYIHR